MYEMQLFQRVDFSSCRYLEMWVKWAAAHQQLMELFGIMQIEALLPYWTGIVWMHMCVCVCLLLFTSEYELVRPVLCEDEDFCAY